MKNLALCIFLFLCTNFVQDSDARPMDIQHLEKRGARWTNFKTGVSNKYNSASTWTSNNKGKIGALALVGAGAAYLATRKPSNELPIEEPVGNSYVPQPPMNHQPQWNGQPQYGQQPQWNGQWNGQQPQWNGQWNGQM